MTQNNAEALIAKKELLEDLIKRMNGVYSEYHKEIVSDELTDTLECINNLTPILQNEQQEVVGEVVNERGYSEVFVDFFDKPPPPNGTKLYTSPPKQIPDGWLNSALVEALNCDYQSTLDSEQVKIFNMGVATLYEIIKEMQSKILTSETNTEVGE